MRVSVVVRPSGLIVGISERFKYFPPYVNSILSTMIDVIYACEMVEAINKFSERVETK